MEQETGRDSGMEETGGGGERRQEVGGRRQEDDVEYRGKKDQTLYDKSG